MICHTHTQVQQQDHAAQVARLKEALLHAAAQTGPATGTLVATYEEHIEGLQRQVRRWRPIE